jgi:Asp-tRNA(Asn)/Glu-tRNA(Gln) amidotransferase C subunit
MGTAAPEFAASISASLSLLTLNVSGNKISVNAPEFAAAISKLQSLHSLKISDNDINTYAPEFVKALDKLPSLYTLDIVANNIVIGATLNAPELIKLLDKLPSLHTLSFSECDNITDEEKSSIQEKLSANIQKYVDLANKIETNGQELSTADLVFLSQCDKDKLKESLIANSSAMQLIDTHMLELLGLCHHVPEEDSASQGMMVFSTILNSG